MKRKEAISPLMKLLGVKQGSAFLGGIYEM